MFAFKDSLTMVLWHPKHLKHVLLLSCLLLNANITKTGKLETVKFHIKAKAGIDALDKKKTLQYISQGILMASRCLL